MTRSISILGATGSIGDSTVSLIRTTPSDTWSVSALTAHSNVDKLVALAKEFRVKFVAIADGAHLSALESALSGTGIQCAAGPSGIIEAAQYEADVTIAAITGAAGLEPTLAAAQQGNTIALANKECLVCSGDLFMAAIKDAGATLLPVDSEHNAIFQVLDQERPAGVRRLVLTASGGPFCGKTRGELLSVTRENALNHPVWSMGAKITIDSATLMNKGLELIEASYLFNRPSAEIDVIIHPQSIIHSMVEYLDGSVLAQLGSPDMRTPIAYAMAWPDRMDAPVERLNFGTIKSLTFLEPDLDSFRCLALARQALETGGQAPNVLNAANEVAVAAFLNNRIKFLDIDHIVSECLDVMAKSADFSSQPCSIPSVIHTDIKARKAAKDIIACL